MTILSQMNFPRLVRASDHLFNLGLSNEAIIQELKVIYYQFSEENIRTKINSLYTTTENQYNNIPACFMNIRCVIYYGRIRVPTFASEEILNYIETRDQIIKSLQLI